MKLRWMVVACLFASLAAAQDRPRTARAAPQDLPAFTLKPAHTLDAGAPGNDPAWVAVDVAPDGSEFLTLDASGKLVRWSSRQFKPVATRDAPPQDGPANDPATTSFRSAAYTADGKQIITTRNYGLFEWLDRESFKPASRMQLPSSYASAISADGKLVANEGSAMGDDVLLYRVPSDKQSGVISVGAKNQRKLLFTRDAKYLLINGLSAIQMYDAETTRFRKTLESGDRNSSTAWLNHIAVTDEWVFGTAPIGVTAWRMPPPPPDPLVAFDDKPEPRTERSWQRELRRGATFASISGGGQILLVCSPGKLVLLDVATGEPVAAIAIADTPPDDKKAPVSRAFAASPRVVRAVPGSSLIVVLSGPRKLEVYDLRELFLADPDNAGARDASVAELWKRLNGAAATSARYAAAAELTRRDELLPRFADLLERGKDRLALSKQATELVAKLDDAASREAAHRELERLAPRILYELKQAQPRATGEKAARLESLVRLAGDVDASPPDDFAHATWLREVLAWTNDPAYRKALDSLPKP